jgi:hypothetical protein
MSLHHASIETNISRFRNTFHNILPLTIMPLLQIRYTTFSTDALSNDILLYSTLSVLMLTSATWHLRLVRIKDEATLAAPHRGRPRAATDQYQKSCASLSKRNASPRSYPMYPSRSARLARKAQLTPTTAHNIWRQPTNSGSSKDNKNKGRKTGPEWCKTREKRVHVTKSTPTSDVKRILIHKDK